MLKNIPALVPPELMKIMMETGHGDELRAAAAAKSPLTGMDQESIMKQVGKEGILCRIWCWR